VLRLDNFRTLTGAGWPAFKKFKTARIDKGHLAEFERLTLAITNGGKEVMPFTRIANVMDATFAAVESAASGQPIALNALDS
jgi:hypothetical protein